MNDPLKYPSLTIISELTKERVAGQMEQVNALDSKANFVLGSATALVSAALILQAVLLTAQPITTTTQSTPSVTSSPTLLTPTRSLSTVTSHTTSAYTYYSLFTNSIFHSLPLLLLIVVYITVMVSAFLAYRIRAYKQAPEPTELYEHYLFEKEETTKAEVFRAMLEAYKLNVITINKKVRWLNTAFLFLGLEALVLAIVLLFQILY